MTLDETLTEWYSKKRRMGCVAATNWFCGKVPGFYPLRLRRYMPDGNFWEHVVATDGRIIIDLTPYNDTFKNGPKGPLYKT